VGEEVVGKLVTVLVPNKNNILEYESKNIIKLNKDGYRQLAVSKIEEQFDKIMEQNYGQSGMEYDK
jgi:hypothetical protein